MFSLDLVVIHFNSTQDDKRDEICVITKAFDLISLASLFTILTTVFLFVLFHLQTEPPKSFIATVYLAS